MLQLKTLFGSFLIICALYTATSHARQLNAPYKHYLNSTIPTNWQLVLSFETEGKLPGRLYSENGLQKLHVLFKSGEGFDEKYEATLSETQTRGDEIESSGAVIHSQGEWSIIRLFGSDVTASGGDIQLVLLKDGRNKYIPLTETYDGKIFLEAKLENGQMIVSYKGEKITRMKFQERIGDIPLKGEQVVGIWSVTLYGGDKILLMHQL